MSRLQQLALGLFLTFPACLLAAADNPPTRVAILMFDGVQIIDFAAPYEVFGQAGFEVYTVSANGGQVNTSMDLKVSVDHSFETAPTASILLIPGGDVHASMSDEPTLDWIRSRAEKADQVLSVCTGSFILAATGLLDGHSATTFHRAFDGMAQQFPKVKILRDKRWVDAGKLTTSAGLASGIDASLHVLARLQGLTNARTVALTLEYDWSPEQGFVRGLMADQYLRQPVPPIQYPKGTQITQLSSVGDQQRWDTLYRVQSTLAPDALLAHIESKIKADQQLRILDRGASATLAWEFTSERGGLWRMTLSPGAVADDSSFEMRTHIERLD